MYLNQDLIQGKMYAPWLTVTLDVFKYEDIHKVKTIKRD